MKKFVLGTAFAMALAGLTAPTSAATWDVNFSFTDQASALITVTGNIVTTCDNCVLNGANITNWSFSWNGPFGASNSGTGANVGGFPGNLSASAGTIQFNSVLGAFTIFSDHIGTIPNVSFGESHPELCGASPADVNCITLIDSNFNNEFGHVTLPFTIATEEISAVPLPAALPLFATGLGALGLLGCRRKRKAQAA